MANLFISIPVPPGDGVGAGVAASATGREKTIQVEGFFTGSLNIEVSLDGGISWATLTTFTQADKKVISVAADQLRVRRIGVSLTTPGLPTVDVSANDDGALFVVIPPVPGSVNTQALGNFRTVTVFSNSTPLNIEVSDDGVNWVTCMTFTRAGIQSKIFTSRFMRSTKTAVIAVGGINEGNSIDNDELVKVTAADTTPDYLAPKLAPGVGISLAVLNPGGNEQLEISAVAGTDELVKITAADTTPDYLAPKLAPGVGISLAVLNPGGNEQVEISAVAGTDELVKVTAADTTPDYLAPKLAAGTFISLSVLNPGANEQVEITGAAQHPLPTGDPHTQYLLLAGRAGGQAAFGGTLVSQELILRGTTASNLGLVRLRSPIQFDDVTAANALQPYSVQDASTQAITAAFVGGVFNASPVITFTNPVFVWEAMRGSPNIQSLVAPGFSAFTLFQALPLLRAGGALGQNPLSAAVISAGVVQQNEFASARTVADSIGINFVPQLKATVAAGSMAATTIAAVQCNPTFSSVASSTINLGTIYGLNCLAPVAGLFQPGSGTNSMTAYIGLNFPAMTFGGDVLKAAVQCALAAATNAYCIRHTGTAQSLLSGQLTLAGTVTALLASATAGISRFDGFVDLNKPIALGGGAAATLGTIGGTGPTAAAQSKWIQIKVAGVDHWIAAWT